MQIALGEIRGMLVVIGVPGGAVGCGTVPQAGRSRGRFSMFSLEFFIDIILSNGKF